MSAQNVYDAAVDDALQKHDRAIIDANEEAERAACIGKAKCVTAMRVFRLKWLPCTNTKPARWKLIDLRFGGVSVIKSRDSILPDSSSMLEEAVFWLCWERDIQIEYVAEDEPSGGYLLMTRNFRTMLKVTKED